MDGSEGTHAVQIGSHTVLLGSELRQVMGDSDRNGRAHILCTFRCEDGKRKLI